jgi:ankyrin repeat protein
MRKASWKMALFLLYAAQLRARFDTECFPPKGEGPDSPWLLYSALHENIGTEINPNIMSEPKRFAKVIERIKTWNPKLSKDYHPGYSYTVRKTEQVAQAATKPGRTEFIDGMVATYTLLLNPEYFAAVQIAQAYNLGPNENRPQREAYDKAIRTMKRLDGTDAKFPLHGAIEAADKGAYLQHFAKGADPNLCDEVGTSAVHLAAEQADIFWLREALKHGGKPNQLNTGNQGFPKETPIFYAISKRRDANALELMAAGADLNHVDGNHNTPLYACMRSGRYGLMIKLIEAGANPKPPEPTFSIFGNGWFTKGDDDSMRELSDEDEAMLKMSKVDYFALKALLIKKGYMKPDTDKKP